MKVPGILQYDRDRGVIYFFDDQSKECLLRIDGVPNVPEGEQIDIHLFAPGGEHHHENCGNRGLLMKGVPREIGAICAAKMERHS